MSGKSLSNLGVHPLFLDKSTLNFQEVFREVPHSKRECKADFAAGITCSSEPFPHCIVENFLSDQKIVDELQQTLDQLEFHQKSNDLYKFTQTNALEQRDEPALKNFRSALLAVDDWLGHLLDVEMYAKVDMFSARYNYTDTLLCHDDELEGRRVAYIYYLVPDDWMSEDGGTLDLFSMDSKTGHPLNIVKSITPIRNSLLLFEVTHKSFHQVAEVISQSKCRLSISGWFHGPPKIRPSLPRGPVANISSAHNPTDIEEDQFYKHICLDYTDPATLSDIQQTFEEESEIQLQDFLCSPVYEQIGKEITSDDIVWRKIGPAIKRNIEVADVNTLPSSIQECIQFLTSDALFLTLSNITGLNLHPLATDNDDESEPEAKKAKASNGQGTSTDNASENSMVGSCGTVSYEVRRWSQGTYTLLHDTDMEQGNDCALDALIHFNCDSWKEEQGGYTSYVAKGEDEELITVEPRGNCLSLVYRDRQALRFVKHINHRITHSEQQYFYDISLVYHESSDSSSS